MRKMVKLARTFLREEDGLETVEYAIIAGLIVVGTITTIAAIGVWVNARFSELETGLSTAAPAAPTP